MLNKQFEEQLEAAMLCIAQEQIHDTPHRFPPDFEMRLMQKCGESEKAWIHTKAMQPVPSRRHKAAERMPRLLTWGSLAAGVTVMLSIGAFMLHEQKNEMTAPRNQEKPEIQEQHPESGTTIALTTAATTDKPVTTALSHLTSITLKQTTVSDTSFTAQTNPEKLTTMYTAEPSSVQTADETTITEITMSTDTAADAPDSARCDTLLKKYGSRFKVIAQTCPADSRRLQDESYMQNKVYSDGILYSAYLSGNDLEYDWTEYVECIKDDTTHPPRLVRNYRNCEIENGFYYSVHGDTAIVHGADSALFADAETLAIPETLGGYPVCEIAPHAFDGFEGAVFPQLTEISIPDCVEMICNRAFYGIFTQKKCTTLSDRLKECKINVPKSVQYIGEYAYGFGTVRALGNTVTLPDTLEYIDRMAFADNSVQIYDLRDTELGKVPYIQADEDCVPLPENFYPEIILPDSAYVCNDDYIVLQRGITKYCRNALRPKQYAEYYVRENLSNPVGDFNYDGQVNLSDTVWLQKYLLCSIEPFLSSQTDWKAGDINQDGILNAVDLTLLKQMLLQDISS